MSGAEKWELLQVKTTYHYTDFSKDFIFSMVKNILSKIQYESMFYLFRKYEADEEEYVQLDLLLKNVKSHRKVNRYLTKLDYPHAWRIYDRNHIVEALKKVSAFCVSFDFRPDVGALGYILHCICENFFYTKRHEIDIYAQLIRAHNKELSNMM